MIIIGDVAGEYDALKFLADLYKGERICLVGDLIDRGPKSKEVVQFCIDNKDRVDVVMGNHEHMFLDWYDYHNDRTYNRLYSGDDWISNGGLQTLQSYGESINIPKEHIDFLRALPKKRFYKNVIVTHAPMHRYMADNDFMLLWNRQEPYEIEETLQVFGHNSFWGYMPFGDPKDPWAICIDTSRDGMLTALLIDDNNGKIRGSEGVVLSHAKKNQGAEL